MTAEVESREELAGQLAARLVRSDARSVVLRGPAGIGKSRMLELVMGNVAAPYAVRKVSGGAAQQHLDFGALLPLLDPDAAPVSAEFELVQQLRRGLVEHAVSTVVFVDDVELLDVKSAGVLEGLAMSGAIVVVATERTTPGGSAVSEHSLSTWLRTHADPVLLGPLGDGEMLELLTEWLGPGEVGSARRLSSMSGGNPLALRELVSSARDAGAIVQEGPAWYLEDFVAGGRSLEQLVQLHLDRLSEPEWDLLRSVAVAGAVPRQVLERVDADAVERLERAELLGGNPMRIAHPLYAEVVRGQLGAEATRRVYSKLATSVVPDDGVDPARVGQWMLDSDLGVDEDVARSGAAAALGRWENGLAARLIQAIGSPSVADLVQLQWACANDGNLDGAVIISERAVAAASTESERVDAGLAAAELLCLQLGRSDEGYAQLAALRASVSDTELQARIDGATALYMHMTGKGSLADSSTRSAVAEEVVTDDARMSVALAEAFGAVFRGESGTATLRIRDAYELAEVAGQPHNTVRVGILDAVSNLTAGRFDQAQSVVDRWVQAADVSPARPAHAVWLGLSAQLAAAQGDVARAILRGREAVRAAAHVDDIGSGGFVRGELRAALVESGVDAPVDPTESPVGRSRVEIRLCPDREVDACAVARAERAVESGYSMWAPWIAVESVRRTASPHTAQFLTEISQTVEGDAVAAFVVHANGLVAGDVDQLGDAVDSYLALNMRPLALDALIQMTDVGLSGGTNIAIVRRRMLVARAVAAQINPGPTPRAAMALRQCAERAELPSERQLEIARLAAAGQSSKEIAAQLTVSVRTVDNHLAAVYRSLELGGRGELNDLPL